MREHRSASRMELLQLRHLRARAEHGSALLRKKREALLAELFRHARPASETHARLAELMQQATITLVDALAVHGEVALRAAARPQRDYQVTVIPRRVWGLDILELGERAPIKRTPAAREQAPPVTGLALTQAADAFEQLVEEALDAAPRELLVRQLVTALTKTSRQVNTLDAKVIPRFARDVQRIARALEERERDERVRVQHLRTTAPA